LRFEELLEFARALYARANRTSSAREKWALRETADKYVEESVAPFQIIQASFPNDAKTKSQ